MSDVSEMSGLSTARISTQDFMWSRTCRNASSHTGRLAVPRLRVQAPVPGRGVVGVEVPNSETAVVRLRTVLTSDAFYRLNQPLAVALGLDVSGAPIAVDLHQCPHFLPRFQYSAGPPQSDYD